MAAKKPTEQNLEERKRLREIEVRWNETRVKQFSFSNNLILTFSLGLLGFISNQLLKKGDQGWSLSQISELRWGLKFAGISVLVGILVTLSRLLDFRYTAKISRGKKKKFEFEDLKETILADDQKLIDGICCHKCLAKWLGRISWNLFFLQLITFLAGAFMVWISFPM
jgi:hypothetical protein